MVRATGDIMSTPVSEEVSVAVALTRIDARLDLIQQQLGHQTELMGRNREDAIRDIETCKSDILKAEARIDVLEKANEQNKATVRTVAVIAGGLGTALGVGATILTKLIQ